MKKTYFISDVHLGEQPATVEKERVKQFVLFLQKLEVQAARIFFVGDLFDFWFEYKYVIPKKHFTVIRQLARMRDKGIEITYLAGNHDFWLGSFFDRELGIHTVINEWSGEIDGKRFYLFHGDGVAKKDHGYRFLKKVLRHRWSIRFFRWLHPDWGIPFARFVSGSSRQYTNRVNLNDQNDYVEFARQRFRDGYDYVIMGHRHTPYELNEKDKKYINLGDWLEHYSYAVFDGIDLRIQYVKNF
jgi:UDP-2,3-diacylglucosamine hydrolase